MKYSSYIPIEDIYRETNCGLDIFLHYFPDSKNCLIKKNSKFKIRDEKQHPQIYIKTKTFGF